MYKLSGKTNSSSIANKEFCAFVFVALSAEACPNPERIADNLAKYREVENVDIVAGKWGLLLRIRTKGQDKSYDFLKKTVFKEKGVVRTNSIISLKQVKPACLALD